jgi:hypothetical protein
VLSDPFKDLPVGKTVDRAGNFTELAFLAIGLRAGDTHTLEQALGFHIGRLDEGFSLLLLAEMPKIGTVSIQGMTNQSGGREGLPGRTAAEDAARPEVDKRYRDQRHKIWADYPSISAEVRKVGIAWSDHDAAWTALEATKIIGPHRAAKIVPVTRHDDAMSPDKQYPVGDGVPQFSLHERSKWLVAANIHADGNWNTLPDWPPVTHDFLDKTNPGGYHLKNRMMKLLADALPSSTGKRVAK